MTMTSDRPHGIGATVPEMQLHYDAGNAFYALWLDPTMCYTCAMFDSADETLEQAQLRKLDHHLDNLQASGRTRLLDVGCGWGALMHRAVQRHPGLRAEGVTVAAEQAQYIRDVGAPGVTVHEVSWADYKPDEPFDAVSTIGAFEHFGRVDVSLAEKLAGYREYFSKVHGWLKPGGLFSLQSVTYGNMTPRQQSAFLSNEIFPGTELPSLAEIVEATRGLFEIKALRNDRMDYAATNLRWMKALKANRAQAEALIGETKVDQFLNYLRLSAIGFHVGNTDLFRIAFQRIETSRYEPFQGEG